MSWGRVAAAVVLGLLGAFSVLGAAYEMLPHDVSYYLYVSREVLSGALPYRDYIDPNLPTIIYLGVPVALLSEWFGFTLWHGYQAFVVLLELVSIAASAWILRQPGGVAEVELRGVILAMLVGALCLVPMGLVYVDSSHFGQREHLALLFVTPYILWHALRAGGGRLERAPALGVAAFAAIGLAIKPHFLAFWAVIEGWSWLRERAGWSRVGLLPPIAFSAYFALLLLLLPDLPTWIGYTWQLYGAYKDQTPFEILRIAPVTLSLAIVLLYRLLPVDDSVRPLRSALAVSTIAWWGIGFLQLRGFPYHFAPAVSLALVLLLVSVVGSGFGRRLIPLVYALLVFVGFGSVENAWRDRFGQDVALTKLFRERAPDGAVLLLSTNVWPSFPAALYADVRWSSRFPALWLLPGLYEDVPTAEPFAYRDSSEMGEIERWHLAAVIEDFERQPPELVLVDRFRFQPGFGETNFDYLAYLGRDPRFRRLWCPYRKAERWERTFAVYERDLARVERCSG